MFLKMKLEKVWIYLLHTNMRYLLSRPLTYFQHGQLQFCYEESYAEPHSFDAAPAHTQLYILSQLFESSRRVRVVFAH
jgi:hypothetical protein